MDEQVIYIMRHGKTVWNSEGRIQGRKDSPLLVESIEDSKKIADFLSKCQIERVFSSPLGRTITTARIVCDRLGLTYEVNDCLQECNHGQFEGMSLEEIKDKYTSFFQAREQNKWSTRWPDGESYEDVYARAQQFIKDKLPLVQRCLIVGHEGINKCILGALMQWQPQKIIQIRQKNNELFVVEANKWSIVKV